MTALHHISRASWTVLVVVLLLAPASTTVSASEAGGATFGANRFVEERGDVASIPLTLSSVDEATVRVESVDNTYTATLDIVDGNGDGTVTLRFNTFLAQRNATGAFRVATNEDEVTVHEVTSTGDTHPTDDYKLAVTTPADTDRLDDVATLVISSRRAESFDAWSAPRMLARNLTSPARIGHYRRIGVLQNGSTLRGDIVVLRLRASGLSGALAAQQGTNVTERFFGMLDSGKPNLSVEQQNPGPEQLPRELLLDDPASTHIVADTSNDTYYVVIDTRRIQVDPEMFGDDPPEYRLELTGREEFVGMFTYSGHVSVWNGEDRPGAVVTDEFALKHRNAHIQSARDDGRLFFRPEPNQSISGWTNVRPGKSVTVVVQGENGFERKVSVPVVEGREENRFNATFDLSDVPDGTNVTVDVRHDGTSLLYRHHRSQVNVPRGSVQITDADTEGEIFGVTLNITVSRGGFVALHRNSTDGPIIDLSRYLGPGKYPGKRIVFDERLAGNYTIVAVVHRNGDGNRFFNYPGTDTPYEANGSIVSDAVSVRFPTTTETESRVGIDVTTEPTDRIETAVERTANVRGESTSPATGQPGFKAIIAVVALLAAVPFVRRYG